MGHPHTRMTGAPWRNDKNGNFCANPDFLDTLKFVWCGPGGTEDKDKVKKYAEEDIRVALTNVVERSFTMREIAFVETVVRSSTRANVVCIWYVSWGHRYCIARLCNIDRGMLCVCLIAGSLHRLQSGPTPSACLGEGDRSLCEDPGKGGIWLG